MTVVKLKAALLEHAEAAGGPWRSFVDDPDALAAQAEHAKTCAVCRAKLGEVFLDDASNEARTSLAHSCPKAP